MIVNDKVYGSQTIDDPLILELIETKEFQRLKGVNQYGAWHLLKEEVFSSRYDHSLGVYFLLKKLGASKEEQVAGLLHDIAHTAFSHVIDYVYDAGKTQHIHEEFAEQVLHQSAIPKILEKHGMKVDEIIQESNFKLLERNIPDLCADRTDYFLRDALFSKRINDKDVKDFLNALTVHDNQIVFSNKDQAIKMSFIFIEMCKELWSPPIPVGSFQLLADVFKLALQKNIIVQDDFFITDNELIDKLKASQDEEILTKLSKISYDHIELASKEDHDFHVLSKPRYIDPKVIVNNELKRASFFEPLITTNIDKLKKGFEKGLYLKVK
tara:strand:+ start:8936 stop:9910 length:975 start_codon:yes stop_codon:yes gene_type:complete